MTPRPSYTRAEAYSLEAHYIACAMREGIWGKGRPPTSGELNQMRKEVGARACVVRQKRSEERKGAVLQAVRDGHETASKIGAFLKISDTCVRKYLRELEARGMIEASGKAFGGILTWRAVDDDSNAAS